MLQEQPVFSSVIQSRGAVCNTLPTPSTDSSVSPPDHPMPASPRTCAFIEHLQGQIVHQATTRERGRTTTRASQDLRNALADMFSLPPLPIPQSPPAGSPSPMAAISTSLLHCDESCHSPAAPLIPATRPHLPEPEPGPSKQPITWDLKDPVHPLHQWGIQQAYKKHIEQAGYNYPVPHSPSVKSGSPALPQETSPQQSTSPCLETTSLRSPGLESISKEKDKAAPLGGHHQPPTMLGGIHQDSWSHQLSCYCYLWLTHDLFLVISDSLELLLLSMTHCSILSYLLSLSYL